MPEPSLDRLFDLAYEELRRLAGAVKQGDRSETLNPTALVHEAYLKLVRSLRLEPESERHFKRLAARAMRQVLVEAARRRLAERRGGGQFVQVTLGDDVAAPEISAEEVLSISRALDRLAEGHPRQAQLVELRFFGGFENGEVARLLEVSESTVDRDWRFARAQLKVRLSEGADGAGPP